ncbi:MAG: class I SAM-dependent methyltransferase [Propionibacteriaceae bacterium]
MPMDVVIDMIVDLAPGHFLDVGTGMGGVPVEVQTRLPQCVVEAVDQSGAMVEATRAKGVSVQVAPIEHLPFGDGVFDVISATWMLYHVEDLDVALAEVRRVLRPGGTFVATTNGVGHIKGLFDLAGVAQPPLSFVRENGAEILSRHFGAVERIDLTSYADFENSDAAQVYLRTVIPDAIVPFSSEPMRFPGAPTIFIAR